MSLRRIAIRHLLLFITGILISGAAIYFATIQALVGEVDTRLLTESNLILSPSDGFDLAGVERRIANRETERQHGDLSYLLIDRTGSRLAGKLAVRIPALGYSDVYFNDREEGVDHGRALAIGLADGSKLVLVADYSPVENLNARLLQIGMIGLAVTIAIGVSAGVALSRAIERRIRATTHIAESIMVGEMDQRMPLTNTGDVFDRQAAVLNAMLDRIQELMAHLQQISRDVAHDLRTPLALLRNNLGAILAADKNHTHHDELTGLLAQSDNLLGIFGAILRIGEIEAGSRRDHFTSLELGDLAAELLATFAPLLEQDGRTLAAGQIDHARVYGDRELIAQALINLIENAAKHTDKGTHVTLDVEHHGQQITVIVRDDGPGIEAHHRATALRRFGRLDASRSKPGNGLGLSLVDSIARLHGGQLVLSDANPGLIATLQLVAADTRARART